ncbi:MAG: gluconokinase, partial [Pseudomonadota bacterium]
MAEKFVIMGVAGSGKSTVGEALEAALGWRYVDGDHLHTRENILKMERGIPLTDGDRAPW